jgi:hypothetical protein
VTPSGVIKDVKLLIQHSVHLALAGFDLQRAVNSLLFQTSVSKAPAAGTHANQIIQDTGCRPGRQDLPAFASP